MHLSHRLNKRASAPFELVHYDVWGPCPVTSPIRFKYFVTFVDDFSHVTWLYLLKSFLSFFLILVHFVLKFKHNHVSIQTLRSDNVKEYFSKPFQSMLQHEILHQTSCLDTPSKNGVAERKNRHILEIAPSPFVPNEYPKKAIGVIVPLFDVTLCLLMLYSLRLPCFPFLLLLLVRGRMMIY